MQPDEARAAAAEAIAEEQEHFEATPLTRRLYICDQCCHDTLTIGYSLPRDSRCHMRIADRAPDGRRLRSTHKCDGLLEGELLELATR